MPPTQPILPDLLAPHLRLVFCGTAAGARSARDHAYYAHPGNMFWRALFAVGLTPRLYRPEEFPRLLPLGIGLTDLAKHHYGNDNQLPLGAYDAAALRAKIVHAEPGVLAFTSKNAARAFYGKDVPFGEQPERIGDTRVFVLPSPSGQARGSWNIAHWAKLAESLPPPSH